MAILLCLWSVPAMANRAKARALTSEGQNLAEAGKVEQALERYEEAMGSDPDYHASYGLAIPLWMRLGKLRSAQGRLETLTLRCRDCAFAWYALGAVYRKTGRFDLAVLAYKIYLAKRPADADAHFGLAMALGALKSAKAPAALRRYLRLETRPSREAYRGQAHRLLAGLARQTPASTQVVQSDFASTANRDNELASIASLVERGQLISAESLLQRRFAGDPKAMSLWAQISEARGQRFEAAAFSALAWLWR